MIEENDIIRTNKRINNEIAEGTKGVVLYVFDKEFLVEFIDKEGNTIGNGMETVKQEDIDLLIKAGK
jgi:hypothetical protein